MSEESGVAVREQQSAKPKGWFSRRHATNREHENARMERKLKQDSRRLDAVARMEHAESRKAKIAELAPEKRIDWLLERKAILDTRIGIGVGAKSERARIAERIREAEEEIGDKIVLEEKRLREAQEEIGDKIVLEEKLTPPNPNADLELEERLAIEIMAANGLVPRDMPRGLWLKKLNKMKIPFAGIAL